MKLKHDYRSQALGCAVLWITSCGASPNAAPAMTGATGIEEHANAVVQPTYAPPGAGAAAPAVSDLRCAADASLPQKTNYSVPGPYRVGTTDMTFEDTARPIQETATHAAAPSRRLVTTIYYPAAASGGLFGTDRVADGGPFPLIVYSHGYSSSRSEAAQVGQRAASYGYIVVAPDFPLSNLLANNGSPDGTDASNQAGDVSYLIDQLLALSRDPSSRFTEAVDETRIGATGVSMGGFTTLLATYHPTLHDPRIKVAVPIAPLSAFFMPGYYHTREVPVLFIHGDLDAFLPYEDSRKAVEYARPHARLVTLVKGTHAAFAIQFDAATTALMNMIMGLPGSDPSNPDGFGCGGVAETLQDGPSPATGLGGEENFVDQEIADGMSPCDGDEYKSPAMDAAEQVALAATAVVAMFEAHFARAPSTMQDACRYLLHELPKHPAVKVE